LHLTQIPSREPLLAACCKGGHDQVTAAGLGAVTRKIAVGSIPTTKKAIAHIESSMWLVVSTEHSAMTISGTITQAAFNVVRTSTLPPILIE
jgi:hypothetical protein